MIRKIVCASVVLVLLWGPAAPGFAAVPVQPEEGQQSLGARLLDWLLASLPFNKSGTDRVVRGGAPTPTQELGSPVSPGDPPDDGGDIGPEIDPNG